MAFIMMRAVFSPMQASAPPPKPMKLWGWRFCSSRIGKKTIRVKALGALKDQQDKLQQSMQEDTMQTGCSP